MKKLLFLFLMISLTQAQDLTIPQNIRFLALGDSYTIGQSVSYNERWPSQLSDSLTLRGYQVDTLRYIATTGWTTQNLLNAVSNQNLDNQNFNLVSVLIGVNNQYQHKPFSLFLNQFPKLLDSAIHYANGDTSHVFVLSIPDYAYTPFGQSSNPNQTSMEIDMYNAAKDSICQLYGVRFFNITPISRQGLIQPNLIASDGLHPSAEQYTLWVNEILNFVDSLSPDGMHHLAPNTLKIYPNPVKEIIHIENADAYYSYKIINLNGQLLSEKVLLDANINIAYLQEGAYILQLIGKNNHTQSYRFLVKK